MVRGVWDLGWNVGREVVPVCDGDLYISQSEEDITELDLLWVLASQMHDLVQDRSLLEGLVSNPPLIRELRVRVGGVERKVGGS